MGSITDFLELELLDHVANAIYVQSATVFVALCTADPTDAATTLAGVEVANTNGYARTAITFGAAASRQVIQSGAVTFPQATGTWGTITHWAITTSATYNGGNTLAHGAFTGSFAPVNGNTPTIPTTEIKIQWIATSYSAGTISAAAADNSLNDSANGFPLFPAGSTVYVSGFTGTPANNSIYTVTSSTVSKLVLSTTPALVNDAAGETVTVRLGGGFTDYTVHNWLNLAFRNTAFTKPATYVGLATTTLLDTTVSIAGLTEVTGNAYARVLVNIAGGASPAWTVAAAGALNNAQAITFPTPTGTWGLVTSCFLVDSASGAGNVLGYNNDGIVDQTPQLNDTVQFAIGALSLTQS